MLLLSGVAPTGPVPPSPTSASRPSTTRPPTTVEPTEAPQPPVVDVTPGPTFAPQQFLTCGQAEPKKALTRIFGGLKVSPGAIPWQVSVQQKPKGSTLPYSHVCGGILIESCWVLTAAHCMWAYFNSFHDESDAFILLI